MEKFLENLEEKLAILDEQERKRVIKRYQSEIEEKKKNGMDETEAVQSLGSLEDIVDEIYKEYHLNEDYQGKKNGGTSGINRLIKKCAEFLSDTCAEISYYIRHMSDKSVETFFEILLKIVVLVIAFALLKIPFYVLQQLCYQLFELLFYPFNSVLSYLSEFVIDVGYLIICITLAVYMFKGYAKKEKKEELISEEKKEPVKSSKEARNYAFVILKVFVYIIAIIPLLLIAIILLLLTILAFFLVYKGVSIIGLAIILLGCFFLNVILTTMITDSLDEKNRNHTLAFIVAIIVLISGSILLVDNLMTFHYPKTLENSSFIPVIDTTTLEIKEETSLYNYNGNIELIVDNSVQDNKVLLELEYYDELFDCVISHSKEKSYLWFYTEWDEIEMGDFPYLYQNSLEDLKKGKIYDYRKLSNVNVTIYANEKTSELLKIEK